MENEYNTPLDQWRREMPSSKAPEDFSQDVMQRILSIKSQKAKPLMSARQWSIAASIVLFISSLSFYFLSFSPSNPIMPISIADIYKGVLQSFSHIQLPIGAIKSDYLLPLLGGTVAIFLLLYIENKLHRTSDQLK